MKKILGIYHRANGVLGFQEKDGTYVAILKSPIGVVTNVKMYYGDPYNWAPDTEGENKWRIQGIVDPIRVEKDEIFEYRTFKVNSREQRFKYFFKFDVNNKTIAYGEFGFQEWIEPKDFNYHGFSFTWNHSSIGKYVGPSDSWVETNWYQIFPDRFASSKKELDILEKDKHQIVGGDLLGIISKLDYIKELGFNGIYLNPIFLASSAHKYDTVDYLSIDPDFGTMEDFEKLVEEINKRGMKIMLDGVFNHCGVNHPFFQDVIKNKENSKYKDWFVIWDINNIKQPTNEFREEFFKNKSYGTFGNTPFMPRFDWSNNEVEKYIISIVEFWTKKGIHAWRMDVADEVSFDMWRKIKVAAKSINNDISLLGEIWYDSILFLNGDQFDSSMNYPFRNNLLDFLVNKKINLKEYVEKIIENKYKYSSEINKGLFNLVGSHDTDRISVVAKNDPITTRFAHAILILSQGVISFYYGDEIDLDRGKGTLNRGTFRWDAPRGNTYEIVSSLLQYRNQNLKYIQENIEYSTIGEHTLIFKYANGDKAIFNFKDNKIKIENKGNTLVSLDVSERW